MTKLKRFFTFFCLVPHWSMCEVILFGLFVTNMNEHSYLMAACLFVVGLANGVTRGLTGEKP